MPEQKQPLQYPSAHIAVFAREPQLGQVKTRLIPAIGAEAALALYKAMTDRTLRLVRASHLAPSSLWVSSNPTHEYFLSHCHKQDIYLQHGADLGQKMWSCAHALLTAEGADSLLILGTDCPALTQDYLSEALAALQAGQDCVLGPARDGGYVLIGLRQPVSEVFQGVEWGTGQVLTQTLSRLRALHLSVTLLAELWDVDEAADLQYLGSLPTPLPWP